MKVLIQRVKSASVKVDKKTVGEIGPGLLLLIGFGKDDNPKKLKQMAGKVVNMRLFPDEEDDFHHFHCSVLDISGDILAVPNFTLYADTTKGRRPDFFHAAEPEEAKRAFDDFVELFGTLGVRHIETGRFGTYMELELINDGPVTISLEN